VDRVVAYDQLNVHFTIGGSSGKVTSITIFRPELVELDGVALLSRDPEDLAEELAQGPHHFVRVDAGLWCAPLGVLVIENDDSVTDGVELLAIQQIN